MKEIKTLSKWPVLPYGEWEDTLNTLHMFMQIVGKVKLALHPFINHWWHAAFYVNSSGLTTGLVPHKEDAFEVNFDFIHHELFIHKTNDSKVKISLYPRSVASFYSEFLDSLRNLDIQVSIDPIPTEVPDPIPYDTNEIYCSYDKENVSKWWNILVKCALVFQHFRSPFRGKASPIHFFWGSFDLNGTRYSGKQVQPPDYGDRIMQFAENEENFSFGFWPGNSKFPYPAFYSYLYPAPKHIETVHIEPGPASFNNLMGEFILLYDDIRETPDPDKMILDFLESTYAKSANLAGWDLKSFEGSIPK